MTCAASFAGTIAPDLNALSGGSVVQVIVGLNSSQTPAPAAMGGVVQLTSLPNAIVAQTTAAAAIALGNDPAVSHVSINHVMVGSGTPLYDYHARDIAAVIGRLHRSGYERQFRRRHWNRCH